MKIITRAADTDNIPGDEILEQVTDGAAAAEESCDYDRLADNY